MEPQRGAELMRGWYFIHPKKRRVSNRRHYDPDRGIYRMLMTRSAQTKSFGLLLLSQRVLTAVGNAPFLGGLAAF
jgi:hypothetical protein